MLNDAIPARDGSPGSVAGVNCPAQQRASNAHGEEADRRTPQPRDRGP